MKKERKILYLANFKSLGIEIHCLPTPLYCETDLTFP